jgi:hypothetical protein
MKLPDIGAAAVGGPPLVGGSTVGATYCVSIKSVVSLVINHFGYWAK